MRIEAAIVGFLKRDGGVLALTGGGKRIYRGKAPADEKAYPRLHYWVPDETPTYTAAGTNTRQPTATFRFEAIGQGQSGYEDARALMDVVEESHGGNTAGSKFSEFRGWMPVQEDERIWVQGVRIEQVQAGDEIEPVNHAKSIFVVAIDVVVNYVDS